MAAAYDLHLEQGADLVETFTWSTQDGTRRDFNPYTAHAQIRQRPTRDAPLVLNLSPYLTVVTGIELDGGSIGEGLRLAIPGTVTATLNGTGFWDLILVNNANPAAREAFLHGKVTLRRAVTDVA